MRITLKLVKGQDSREHVVEYLLSGSLLCLSHEAAQEAYADYI
jgi:hypothetical protein